MVVNNISGNYEGDLLDSIKDAGKYIVSIPGKIVALNVKPVGEAAGGLVENVTTPLKSLILPVGLLAIVGAFFYFKSKKVDIHVPKA